MNVTKKTLVYFHSSILIFLAVICNSQDAVYSQFYNAPLLLNPAFAGGNTDASVSIMYRNQWPLIDNAYQTYSVSYDQFNSRLNSGIGLNIFADRAGSGALSTYKFDGIYSYRARIKNQRYLKGAISVSYGQRRLDWDRFIFYDALHPIYGNFDALGNRLPSAEVVPTFGNVSYLSIGSGFLYVDPKFYIGLSLDNLNKPNSSFYKVGSNGLQEGKAIKYSIHGGYQIDVLKKIKPTDPSYFITPNILMVDHGGFKQINAGFYGEAAQFIYGGAFRHTTINLDALVGVVGFRFDTFKIIYSFDYNLGSIGFKGGGSHEVGMSFKFGEPQPKTDINDCLQIFK
jgi:type IX secretion system PorP/SprF family membrane protein